MSTHFCYETNLTMHVSCHCLKKLENFGSWFEKFRHFPANSIFELVKKSGKKRHILSLDEKKMENFGRHFENFRHFADNSIFELVKKSGKKWQNSAISGLSCPWSYAPQCQVSFFVSQLLADHGSLYYLPFLFCKDFSVIHLPKCKKTTNCLHKMKILIICI